MTDMSLTTFDFHGASLIISPGDTPSQTIVAMKPLVEGMGLDWSYQFRKIKEHPVLSKGVAVIAIPSDGGMQDMTGLPLTRLNFWMATIHPDRLKGEDIRERVIDYQEKCADALFAHFFGAPQGPQGSHRIDLPFHAKHHDEWSMEEMRVKMAEAHLYRRVLNPASALWIMEREGFPMPPAELRPAWTRESDMFNRDIPPGSVTITVTPDRKAA